jgi:glycine cleavage system regulatory protein
MRPYGSPTAQRGVWPWERDLMRTTLVLTVLGDDRPGIVEQLSNRVLEAGANWEESRMAHLSGKFAGLLRVSVDADRADTLARALTSLSGTGLTVVVEPGAQAGEQLSARMTLQLVGHDRPGIVRDIARVLAAQQVNIEELESEVASAPMTGEPLFRARAHLRLPASASPEAIVRRLESLAGELMVDLSVDHG